MQYHSCFLFAQKLIYEPAGLVCTDIKKDPEGEEYGGCSFVINNRHTLFRVAKITTTKKGQFVTLYKRNHKGGVIMPYDTLDGLDLVVVTVAYSDRFGQFVFPKSVLIEQDILSQNSKGGKRALRVYPAWDIVDNAQAKKTQKWQLQYFFEINKENALDKCSIIKELYSL